MRSSYARLENCALYTGSIVMEVVGKLGDGVIKFRKII